MSGWERLGGPRSKTRFGRDSAMNERIPSSRAIRLGRVTPQAPGHRTIYCNDREANQPVRFKVCQLFLYTDLRSSIYSLCMNLRVRTSQFYFSFSFCTLVEEICWELEENRHFKLFIFFI